MLPRFEVKLTCDQTHLVKDWRDNAGEVAVSGQVLATYTFGENVAGHVVVTVLKELSRWEVASRSPGAPALEEGYAGFRILASTNTVQVPPGKDGGTFELRVARSELTAGSPLLLEASFVDEATGERQNGTTQIPVTYAGNELDAHLETTDGGETYKPGLPLPARVKLSLPGGEAPSTAQLTAGGVLQLRATKTLVDWRAERPADIEVVISVADVLQGTVVVQITLPADDAQCCDPLATAASEDEYNNKMGCCPRPCASA